MFYTRGGAERTRLDPVVFAREMEQMGAGEIMITSVERDGTMQGYDLELIQQVTSAVAIPVIACGGAGRLAHFREAVQAGAAAVAAGSQFVFQGRHRAVLISFPTPEELVESLARPRRVLKRWSQCRGSWLTVIECVRAASWTRRIPKCVRQTGYLQPL